MATLTNAKAFKGILQYKSTDNFTKEAGYVYFIREFNENGEETGNAEIYFGNRKYGDVNVSQLSEIENGTYVWNWDGSESGTITQDQWDALQSADNILIESNNVIVPPLMVNRYESDISIFIVSTVGLMLWNLTVINIRSDLSYYTNQRDVQYLKSGGLKTINGESLEGSGNIDMPYYDGEYIHVKNGLNDDFLIYALPSSADGYEDDILATKNTLKTVNGQSLVGDDNIVVGNIISEEDDSLSVDDVDTNTYVKYVAQTLTEEQKAQVRTNTGTYSKPSDGIPKTDLASAVQTSLGLADTSIQSKIITSTVRTGTVNISANTMTHLTSGLTGSTTIKIIHHTITNDAEWGVKFFINDTTVPSIAFDSSSTSYPIVWINNTAPSFETGYMYEVTFKQFNNKYLAVCGKFKI